MEKKKTSDNASFLDGKVNKAVLYHAIKMYQSNKRQGTASTKTRANVSGGGRKPWKQKHTGRARAGSIRSPLWKGGGVVFGPHPRNYSYTVPQKIRTEALKSSLNAKQNEKKLISLENLAVTAPKTKELLKALKPLKLAGKSLIVVDLLDKNLQLASRNIAGLSVKRAVDLNALDVLSFDNVVLTKAAVSTLEKRFTGEK